MLVSVGRAAARRRARARGGRCRDRPQAASRPTTTGARTCRTSTPPATSPATGSSRTPAFREGEVAAENAMGHESTIGEPAVPRPIYTDPEIAGVGLTEAQARERHGDATSSSAAAPWVAIARAVMSGNTTGWVKTIHETTYGELLGVVIVGPHATDLIGEAVVALDAESTIETVADGIAPHPTLAEAHQGGRARRARPCHPPAAAAEVGVDAVTATPRTRFAWAIGWWYRPAPGSQARRGRRRGRRGATARGAARAAPRRRSARSSLVGLLAAGARRRGGSCSAAAEPAEATSLADVPPFPDVPPVPDAPGAPAEPDPAQLPRDAGRRAGAGRRPPGARRARPVRARQAGRDSSSASSVSSVSSSSRRTRARSARSPRRSRRSSARSPSRTATRTAAAYRLREALAARHGVDFERGRSSRREPTP